MKTVAKLAMIAATLLATSCSPDKHSDLGSGIIGEIDSSAISYDGVFHTEEITPDSVAWNVITDELSGLHRYRDFLARGQVGNIQSEIIIGSFEDEESFGYTTFYTGIDIDTIEDGDNDSIKYDTAATINTVAWYVDSLIRKEECDSVTTALTFFLNDGKHTEDYYNIEIATLPYSEDSTWIDTTKRHVMQNVIIPGDTNKFTIDLPYHYYQKQDLDTVWSSNFDGTSTFSFDLQVVKTTIEWETGETDSTVKIDSSYFVNSGDSIETFKSSSVVPYYYFGTLDSTTESEEIDSIFYDYGYIYFLERDTTIKDTDTTVIDTVWHLGKVDSSRTDSTLFEDTLFFPTYNYTVSDTNFWRNIDEDTTVHLDSTYEIFDTLVTVTKNEVVQVGIHTWDSVKTRSRAYYPGDSIQNIDTSFIDTGSILYDTLNLLFKNISERPNAMVHLTTNPVIRVIGHKDSKADTVSVLPNQSRMSVFSDRIYGATDSVTISGGREQFVRLKINTDSLWNIMYDSTTDKRNYLSIVQTQIEVPVKNAVLPSYLDSSITVRTTVSNKKMTNGELLSDSGSVSKTAQFTMDSSSVDSYIKADITDFMIDLYYGSEKRPSTYLYIWIDGSEMGQITIDETAEYKFTYIVQNKL